MKNIKRIIGFVLICFIVINVREVKAKSIEKAYTYNQTSGASNYCITGEEETCKETTCYINEASGSCPAGTIIKYRVNDTTIKYFYVLHDDGATMTLQQRESTVYNISWNPGYTTEGPKTSLSKLEDATNSWVNVNNQTYQMGTTNFNGTNAYTGCDNNLNCITNAYTLESRSARARMITVQEAVAVGCGTSEKSCPIWMYNYLIESTKYGGTVDDATGEYMSGGANYAYWMMNAYAANNIDVFAMFSSGFIRTGTPQDAPITPCSARAVVVVNKEKIADNPYNDSKDTSSNNKSGNKIVNVEDTLKSSYIGYLIGAIILILGIMVIYKSYKISEIQKED